MGPPRRSLPGETDGRGRPRPREAAPPLARVHAHRRGSWRARARVRGPTEALLRIVGLTMDAGPRYLEGTTVGSGRDIIGEPTILSNASVRSEEHTSELQSHVNLVCRLLLGTKKAALRR